MNMGRLRLHHWIPPYLLTLAYVIVVSRGGPYWQLRIPAKWGEPESSPLAILGEQEAHEPVTEATLAVVEDGLGRACEARLQPFRVEAEQVQ